MFKRPRRTVYSDKRCSYEAVHENIVSRLPQEEHARYLVNMLPLLNNVDTLTPVQARALFAELADGWMTKDEKQGFTSASSQSDVRGVQCTNCGSNILILNETTAEYICENCGVTTHFIGPSSSRYLPYDFEEPAANCPYKRSNHFQEWLNSFMAKQTTTIPDEVYTTISMELKKHRLHDMSRVNNTILRGILKRHRLNKYYENIPFLLFKIKGETPPTLSPQVEHELRTMFNDITTVYDDVVKKVAPNRRNFLSYSYTIYKLLQLLELDHFLHFFPLLKSREKLMVQDKIWKAITGELGWRYIPSV